MTDMKLVYLLILFFCFSIISCKNKHQKAATISDIVTANYEVLLKQSWDSINATKLVIKEGDLVCRTGFDYISKSLQSFNNKDKTYSHSGLLFKENGVWMVYHSIAGEDENPSECFKKEPLDSFINPEKKYCFGIFRYKIDSSEISCMHNKFSGFVTNKIKFDKLFDMKEDEKLYCSEAIAKSLLTCTNGRVKIPTTIRHIKKMKNEGYKHLEGKEFEYWALDNLYLNEYCDSIKKVIFPMGYPKPTR